MRKDSFSHFAEYESTRKFWWGEEKDKRRGVIWRIGDGSKIRIWRDNWLPRNEGLKITSETTSTRLHRVKQLFVPGRREWNSQLVNETFPPHDVEQILSIGIHQNEEDFVAWNFGKHGL
ncbi:hypothetical protein BRADI_2g05096v3 [Brachypodium distachyon]|uniref:Reverse transcriptase zinc-binding domain-containing protein n=1 Tax=Brachypodium distachyon TaxID=15368 RepID=A0A2K2D723_BRADI|nr:hypothetical protein BRADI_2g05096v3 [Brachypodium distachyon]